MLRRLVGFGAAILFIQVCLSSCIDVWNLLEGSQQSFHDLFLYNTALILPYIGTTTVRESPLVIQVMNNDTSPRNSSIYLRSETETSTVDCGVLIPIPGMFTNEFQRQIFTRLMLDTQYNLTFLQTHELVAPVIDCTFTGLVFGDPSSLRLFFIMRAINNPEDVRLLTVSMQTVDYQFVNRTSVHGPAAVASITFLDDLKATEVKHHFVLSIGYPFSQLSFQAYEYVRMTADTFWELKSIPSLASATVKHVHAACRQGIYKKNERDQSNTGNAIWPLDQDPLQAISAMRYFGSPTLRNSWAWVHGVHIFLVVGMLFNLVVLVAISSNRLRADGQLWLGDAFIMINSRLWLLLPIVLISWALEGFWTLLEFCIHDGNAISKMQSLFIYESIVRADLMILCICLADIMGRTTRERVEPVLALVMFYVIFDYRLTILQWSPTLTEIVTTYTNADFYLSVKEDPAFSLITPMRLWSVHELQVAPARFVVSALTPIFAPFIICIAGYILMRKVFRRILRRFKHEVSVFNPNETHLSDSTLFEEATGTKLYDRSGFVSHYENTKVVHGVNFATADGIYSSGFVIANGQFLVQTSCLWEIWVIKITGIRFTDIYVYDVKGDEVQQRSRLVYPLTLSVRDLLSLNIHKLQ